jgi:hypothetical protein
MENNPIIRKRWKIQHILGDMTACQEGTRKYGTLGWKESGLRVSDQKRFVGRKFQYILNGHSVVEKTVILPKFKTPALNYVGGLATEIAALLAVYELAKYMGVDVTGIE